MYKIEISNNTAINIGESFDSQKNIINMLKGVYNVEIKEYPDNNGKVSDNGTTLMYGELCETLTCASKLSVQTDKVAKVMHKNLMTPDSSSVLILNTVDGLLNNREGKEVINVVNNLASSDYLKALMPCEVDYVAIMTSDSHFSCMLDELFKHDTTSRNTEIGYREVDIFVAKVE